ncbi:sterol desaturase/sphingolipid hydroxylase (fatty acid hydroxylase superfamily) [Litorimonas taeanensis]|uniref:Sterol desaturase/sphingolipid hydroxylase (Fatty acid hydroxylase superfamily) n=1 Tax=Litorimonas taeanensis TaxID=568099 RepID=A0A420WDU0_9PROT|nr:sterol desaturase family protein [Litorimonas taeanensis]RKQ69080.1 sterol desaturase/sphingolipid hydroxylase (fatty acid hydroxylase superfamily) [Litorimonas taeanensis]
MDGAALNFPFVLAWAAPFFVLSVAAEWLLVSRKKIAGKYEKKDAFASMAMGLGNLISGLLFGAIGLSALFFVWQFRVFDLGYSLPVILLTIIVQDFLYYWKHRISHEVRWFWSAHIVHHSSEHYNLTTALRQPWHSEFTGYVLLTSPLVLLGFHPLLIVFIASINLVYQFWIHTEAIDKMPSWFECIMNTPSHHRVHHGTHPLYLDSNYAGMFIIWDKMFGTFVAEQSDIENTYGVVKPIETFNPIKIAFSEWVAIFREIFAPKLSFTQRLGYMFGRPGYSHDGSRQTSVQIKQNYYAQQKSGDAI